MNPEADLTGQSVRTHNPADARNERQGETEVRARARLGQTWAAGQGWVSARIGWVEAALPGWTAGRQHMPPATAWRLITPTASEAPEFSRALWMTLAGIFRALVITGTWLAVCAVATRKRAAVTAGVIAVLSVVLWLTR